MAVACPSGSSCWRRGTPAYQAGRGLHGDLSGWTRICYCPCHRCLLEDPPCSHNSSGNSFSEMLIIIQAQPHIQRWEVGHEYTCLPKCSIDMQYIDSVHT